MSEQLTWFKSSHSDAEGDNCVSVALTPTTTHIRDTKLAADSPQLKVRAPAWSAFISATPTAPSPGS
ncbi:DUF397 domain-containing protein [Streptomyces phaeochromogenes]|uniref:DUF397 domain-containing protein n=1 Tax=Streptomyces phaeochromogenes TaxID=1923 RepID=UPI00225A785A|nr:DUF397 domain-containing protein [Streptomyces phaeochromogenes]MCX5605415.1 DUF397 domain-containing protein [Streptomyces phaeochromogenes]WSS95361.1 DUF397 domain-containing protein [Streptomyces phaeochromogenes]